MIRLRNADRSRGSPAGRFFAKCKTAVVPLIVLLPAICSDQSCGTQSDAPKDTPTPDLQDPVVGMRDRVVQAVRGEIGPFLQRVYNAFVKFTGSSA